MDTGHKLNVHKLCTFRSSHQMCCMKKVFLEILQNLRKTAVHSLFISPATLLKKIPWHRCFSGNFAKFLRTPFLESTFGRLLMYVQFTSCVHGKILFQTKSYLVLPGPILTIKLIHKKPRS